MWGQLGLMILSLHTKHCPTHTYRAQISHKWKGFKPILQSIFYSLSSLRDHAKPGISATRFVLMTHTELSMPQVLSFIAKRLQNEQQPVLAPALYELSNLQAEQIRVEHLPWLEKIDADSRADESQSSPALLNALAPKIFYARLKNLQPEHWEADPSIIWVTKNFARFSSLCSLIP